MGDSKLIPTNRFRILIVDDERIVREVFRQIIQFEVPELEMDFAKNGAEAVESFCRYHQGLILLDLCMPVMSGETAFYEICRICASENMERPSVVFCTGFNPSDSDGVRAIVDKDEAHCLLQKPVRLKVLVEALKSRLCL